MVTVNQAPLTEMIDESVGGLFQCGDPEDLSRAVVACLDDPEGRTAQAERGRARVLDLYTYEHNAASYEAIYSAVTQ